MRDDFIALLGRESGDIEEEEISKNRMEVATETIYNLIPRPRKEEKRKRIYRSKYDPKAPLTGSTFGLHGTTVTVGKGINDLKKTCVISSTFGPTPNKPNPSNFLRKGSRPSAKHQSEGKVKRYERNAKPSVPSCNDKPIMGLKTCKNYIVSNATQAIIQKPKFVSRKEQLYIEKETYGKIPTYLQDVKKEMEMEQRFVDECVKEQGVRGMESGDDFEILEEGERLNLINSLKSKWDHVNSKFQKICHRVSIETLGDIKRKEAQEAELQQLEEDIERLSRPGPLYIRK